MADKLSDARLKLKRAKKHIVDVDAAVKSLDPCKVTSEYDPKQKGTVFRVKSIPPIPADLPLIAGDALFNLRSALDQTAWQLWVAAGSQGSATSVQFPTAAKAAEYSAKIGRHIKGAGQDVVKALTTIEAYQGGQGHQLWMLHELNNTDKHRLLLTITMMQASVNLGVLTSAFFQSRGQPPLPVAEYSVGPNTILYPLKVGDEVLTDHTGTILDQDVQFPIDIAFGEPKIVRGDTVVKTLQDMSNLVADIIDQLGRLL